MRTPSPPTPDDEPWAADSASRSGAAVEVRATTVDRLVVLGYITAVSMPPIGFVLGMVFAIRSAKLSSKHGPWIIVVSIIASVVWVLIIAGGALSTPNTDF